VTAVCLANARLVLPDGVGHGQIVLADGRIAAIDPAAGTGCPPGAIDCQGDWVMPGLIELHTDNLERHISPRPGVDWPHDAALISHDAELASVGITTVFDALRVGSDATTEHHYAPYARGLASELLALRGRGALRISHYVHLRAEVCSETLIDELEAFSPADRIGIVSVMDHTPGQRQFRDLSQYRRYMMGKVGLSAAEFEAHAERRRALGARVGEPHRAAASAAAQRLGAIVASHDDTLDGDVAASKAQGATIAEFPTTESAARACRAVAMSIVMGAPNLIRGGSHSGNVAAKDLAAADLIDVISSDYIPGALLLAAFQLAEQWGDMARAMATVTANAADAANLRDRGRLEVGQRGDLIRVSQTGRTPQVRETWVRGMRVA
jgi:alpha-D-ribose 1-methylphosphonate 5-triphosphate diphosphatase